MQTKYLCQKELYLEMQLFKFQIPEIETNKKQEIIHPTKIRY